MSYSKCSNLEAKNVVHFKLCNPTDKKPNYNRLINEIAKTELFRLFYAPEN